MLYITSFFHFFQFLSSIYCIYLVILIVIIIMLYSHFSSSIHIPMQQHVVVFVFYERYYFSLRISKKRKLIHQPGLVLYSSPYSSSIFQNSIFSFKKLK